MPRPNRCEQGERGGVQPAAGLQVGALEEVLALAFGQTVKWASAIAAPPSGDSSMPSSTASSRLGAMSLSAARRTMKSPKASEACDCNTRPMSSLS